MKKSIFMLLFLTFLHGQWARSQTTPVVNNFTSLVQVLPPSPNASSLGKFGGVNVNLSSGSLNLNIPIYDYSSTNLKLPISLNYNSNSIRVDEMGSAVGMSWALNAGGVITRTVYGMADERKTRVAPPASFPLSSDSLFNFLLDIAPGSFGVATFDGQPDLFSFNFAGYSGRFILDSSLANPILLTYSGIRIESHLSITTPTDYYFRITTPDGVQYWFGGNGAIESSKSTTVGTEPVKLFEQYAPTAFYLTEVVHPNRDTVWLTYTGSGYTYYSSSSEMMMIKDSRQVPGGCVFYAVTPPEISDPNPKSENQIDLNSLSLSGITSSGGAQVKFNYIDRTDGADKLLSDISIYQPGQTSPYKRFGFNYQYAIATDFFNGYTDSASTHRPFLTGFTEYAPDSSQTKAYKFKYNDIDALPPRLSFAQDHYGYFNGKDNSTLIPVPTDIFWRSALPDATANREVDSNYCLKGLLTNIVYPTGGQDSIVYESNTIYGLSTTLPADTTIALNTTSITHLGPEISDTITVQIGQQILFSGNCTYNGDPGLYDPLHDLAFVNFSDINDPLNAYNFSIDLHTEDVLSQFVTLDPGKTYVLTLQASGNNVSSHVGFTYAKGAIDSVSGNQLVGGNRIKRVITNDGLGNLNIKRYYYGSLSSPDQSSGLLSRTPKYDKVQKFQQACNRGTLYVGGGAGAIECGYSEYDYLTMYSNTQDNLFTFPTSPVSYSSVLESFGENFDNGGIAHSFLTVPDASGANFIGDDILSAPMTSNAWRNGSETRQYTFKNGGESMIPVKDVYTHYQEDMRVDSMIQSYLVNYKFLPGCFVSPPDALEMLAFDVVMYSYPRRWWYPDTVRTLTYDIAGTHYVSDTLVTVYGNLGHALPTQIRSTLSDGRAQVVNNAYPYDLILTGTAETARQALVSKYMISPILQQQVTKGGGNVFTARTDYAVFSNNLVLPRTQNVQIGNYPAENRVELLNYNSSGKIMTQAKENDAPMSYIWDYRSMYLVAQVTNSDSASIAYTSFEADGTGNWTVGSGSRDTTAAITGNKSYVLSSDVSKSGLNSAVTYIISYWTENSSPFSITGTLSGYPVKGKTIAFNNHSWTLYVHKVSGQTAVTITGSGHIDELRLYPATAQMTTYTYSPLIGMTSQTDPGNRITYYEYDGLARLKRVRDQDYNILKSLEYQYQASSGCGGNCYSIAMQTFAGTNTLSYPVGVFNVYDSLLGNATNAAGYISLWNADTANARIGTLAAGKDSLHFNITLNTGQTMPAGVTGCRYYQYDLAWNVLDGVRNFNGVYVDFGDGTRMPLAKGLDTPRIIALNTTVNHFQNNFNNTLYLIHTYSDTSLKTLTFYHNDATETASLDNLFAPATSLTKVKNFRGNMPQYTTGLGGSCYQQASALSVAGIANWNSINTVILFSMNVGDGITPLENIGYAQDFMKNNKGLEYVQIAANYYSRNIVDSNFKISLLKSDWNTYFPNLEALSIMEDQWNDEDLSTVPLHAFVYIAGNQNHNNDPTNNPIIPIPSGRIDTVINQIAFGTSPYINNGFIIILSGGPNRTSASDSGVAALKAKGCAVTINGVNQ